MGLFNPAPMISVEHDAKTDFTYDSRGNVLTFNCRSGGLSGKIVGTMTMTYDSNGYLTSAVFVKA